MGVPKFYRWISERYPCLSEVLKEYQVCDEMRRLCRCRENTTSYSYRGVRAGAAICLQT